MWRLSHGKKWPVWAPGTTALTEARSVCRICTKLELINIVGPELSLWLCMVFPRVLLHFTVTCLQNPTNVLKHPGVIEQQSTQVSEEAGRGGVNASQTPTGGFSVFSRDQAIHCYWVNVGHRLTLTAFILCCLALRLQGVQHKENTASSKATLNLVGFISSSLTP